MSIATQELDLRFPIGKFDIANFSSRSENVETIAELPLNLRTAVDGLSDEQLDTQYRPDGWTLRQTVHHIADSHMNSIIRFKLALTEDEAPTIRPYYEDRWAELADSKLQIEISLGIIDGVHARWAELLRKCPMQTSRKNSSILKQGIDSRKSSCTVCVALEASHGSHNRHARAERLVAGWTS